MSRLIFLNLPPTITPPQLRTALAAPPQLAGTTVTDLKLVPRRRFAFVGYADDAQAARVREWFDGSYALGGGKVKVDLVSDETKKVKLDTEQDGKRTPAEAVTREDAGVPAPRSAAGPSKLQEFMSVMKGDDGVAADLAKSKAGAKDKGKGKQVEVGQQDGEQPAAEPEADDDDDAAWLRRRQVAAEGGEPQQPAPPAVDADEQLITTTARLFVRNLPFVATADALRAHFASFGPIESVHLPQSLAGEPLGTAHVQYREPADAVRAWRGADKTAWMGRLLHVLPGRARPGGESGVAGADGAATDGVTAGVLGKTKEARGEVKKGVDDRRKKEGRAGVNWASLYMNADAVAASVADRMGIDKASLLSGESANPAVALALAETAVVADVKTFFAEHGLNLDALAPGAPRSATVVLIKNIPYGTTERALRDLFEPHGELVRLLVPPAGTLGVAEYALPGEAAKAFRALAYRRIGNSVLYLEKGPANMFSAAAAKAKADAAAADARAEALALADKAQHVRLGPSDDDEAGSTLYLKSLSWTTTTDRLHALLGSLPGFSFARVQTRPDPKKPGATLSMGYGFVGFATKDDARRGLAALDGLEVDGKAVEVKWAQRGADDDKAADKGKAGDGKKEKKGTKVLVKNLPFEATKKDVRELFSAYGSLKSLRLPTKSTLSSTGARSTRGFAFLEFTTAAEAARAIEALKHTHLLGRHLVLEYANEGEGVDVDALRERVGRDARAAGAGGDRRKRKSEWGREGRDEDDGLEV